MASKKTGNIESDVLGVSSDGGYNGYKVKRNKVLDNVMIVVSLLAAIALWTYVYSTTNTVSERTFNLVSIEKRNSDSLFEDYNMVVQNMNTDTMSVTVMGSRDAVNGLDISDIKAYVNLGGISEAGEYRLEVMLDLPEGISGVSQSESHVEVLVDKSTVKNFDITQDRVILGSYNLESGYEITDVSTNVSSVKLEGSSGDIEKVRSVGVITGALGTVRNSMTASCKLVLLDASGNVIDLPNVHVTSEVDNVEAYIKVIKEKKVPLSVGTVYGCFDSSYITLSPAEIVIKGSPELVDGYTALTLGNINEKDMTYPLYVTEIGLGELEGLEVTDAKGDLVDKVTVTVDLSALESRTVENVPIISAETIVGYTDVLLVARSEDENCREMLMGITADSLMAYLQDGMTRYAVDVGAPFDEYLFDCGNFVETQEGVQ